MVDVGLALIVGIPVAWHFALVGVAYVDAPNHDMDPVRWAGISLLVPLFGFLAYLFEREERLDGPDDEMFVDGTFEIHESRADDVGLEWGGEQPDEDSRSDGGAEEAGPEASTGDRSEQ